MPANHASSTFGHYDGCFKFLDTTGSGPEFSMRDTNSQERGEGKAFRASRSKALSNSGRKRMKAITSGRIPVLIAHSHHSCTSTSKSM